ncbi:MAG: catalase-related domain-containing protein, partial [Bacteroidota bacterium]
AGKMDGGFNSYTERIDAQKVRARSKSFFDHFSQATLFYNSQTEPEKQHLIDAFRFELAKVESIEIRQRQLMVLAQVDQDFAQQVAYTLGLQVPSTPAIINHAIPADGDAKNYQPAKTKSSLQKSAALSMAQYKANPKGRKVAFLVADGVDENELTTVKNA